MYTKFDKLMKSFEPKLKLSKSCPIIARIDGRAFHTFCKNLKKPQDPWLVYLMDNTTEFLVRETGALIGYTQSDEINLLFYTDNPRSDIFFSGKHSKMTSILASLTTGYFNKLSHFTKLAYFDCRVFNVTSKELACKYFIWREIDAIRNSVSLLGRTKFSHKQLYKKTIQEVKNMLLAEHSIDWNNCSDRFKRGQYIQKRCKYIRFTTEEISKLPANHNARKDPSMEVRRSVIEKIKLPCLKSIINVQEVLFNGEEPIKLKAKTRTQSD